MRAEGQPECVLSGPRERQIKPAGHCLEHTNALRDHLAADTVAFDYGYPIVPQVPSPSRIIQELTLLAAKRSQLPDVGNIFQLTHEIDHLDRLRVWPLREGGAAHELLRNLVITHGVDRAALAEIRTP